MSIVYITKCHLYDWRGSYQPKTTVELSLSGIFCVPVPNLSVFMPSSLHLQQYNDGITNRVMGVYHDDEASQVLVRVFGERTDNFINRKRERDILQVSDYLLFFPSSILLWVIITTVYTVYVWFISSIIQHTKSMKNLVSWHLVAICCTVVFYCLRHT